VFPARTTFSADALRIALVADFEPSNASIEQVGIELLLGDNAFTVVQENQIEQFLAHALDVIAVEQPFSTAWDDAVQAVLTIRERQISQSLHCTPEQSRTRTRVAHHGTPAVQFSSWDSGH
jgi:hypothetical protein